MRLPIRFVFSFFKDTQYWGDMLLYQFVFYWYLLSFNACLAHLWQPETVRYCLKKSFVKNVKLNDLKRNSWKKNLSVIASFKAQKTRSYWEQSTQSICKSYYCGKTRRRRTKKITIIIIKNNFIIIWFCFIKTKIVNSK